MRLLKKENRYLKVNKKKDVYYICKMKKIILAEKVVEQMMKDDLFSQWLGIKCWK